MQPLLENTEKLLSQIIVILNAYHMATMTPEQREKYEKILADSNAVLFDKKQE